MQVKNATTPLSICAELPIADLSHPAKGTDSCSISAEIKHFGSKCKVSKPNYFFFLCILIISMWSKCDFSPLLLTCPVFARSILIHKSFKNTGNYEFKMGNDRLLTAAVLVGTATTGSIFHYFITLICHISLNPILCPFISFVVWITTRTMHFSNLLFLLLKDWKIGTFK